MEKDELGIVKEEFKQLKHQLDIVAKAKHQPQVVEPPETISSPALEWGAAIMENSLKTNETILKQGEMQATAIVQLSTIVKKNDDIVGGFSDKLEERVQAIEDIKEKIEPKAISLRSGRSLIFHKNLKNMKSRRTAPASQLSPPAATLPLS